MHKKKSKKLLVARKASPLFELEFVDMEHTLKWLLETVTRYDCDDSVKHHLKAAKASIHEHRMSLFKRPLMNIACLLLSNCL